SKHVCYSSAPSPLPSEHICYSSAPSPLPSDHVCHLSTPLLILSFEHACHPSSPLLILLSEHEQNPSAFSFLSECRHLLTATPVLKLVSGQSQPLSPPNQGRASSFLSNFGLLISTLLLFLFGCGRFALTYAQVLLKLLLFLPNLRLCFQKSFLKQS